MLHFRSSAILLMATLVGSSSFAELCLPDRSPSRSMLLAQADNVLAGFIFSLRFRHNVTVPLEESEARRIIAAKKLLNLATNSGEAISELWFNEHVAPTMIPLEQWTTAIPESAKTSLSERVQYITERFGAKPREEVIRRLEEVVAARIELNLNITTQFLTRAIDPTLVEGLMGEIRLTGLIHPGEHRKNATQLFWKRYHKVISNLDSEVVISHYGKLKPQLTREQADRLIDRIAARTIMGLDLTEEWFSDIVDIKIYESAL